MTTELFNEHRDLLTGVAYRILGTVADAEDVVQETWLRWSQVDQEKVADSKAYLVRVAANLAIDRLRRLKARKESYVGPWLPEPISTAPDVAEHAELADTVEFALLVVLETLSPLERTVFVLREAFGFSHAEIAEMLDRGEPAVRQLAKRAREHVRERRPRYDVDRQERRRITEQFIGVCAGGDLTALMGLLAKDVTLVSDSGGKMSAPRRVLYGRDHVGRFLSGISNARGAARLFAQLGLPPESTPIEMAVAHVNGAPAIVITVGGHVVTVVSLVVNDGLIETIYLIINPDKIGHI